MTFQDFAHDNLSETHRGRYVAPIVRTVSGPEGSQIIDALTVMAQTIETIHKIVTATTALHDRVYQTLYTEASGSYDPDFVAEVLQADDAAPEASFDNVVDMLNWLNRD